VTTAIARPAIPAPRYAHRHVPARLPGSERWGIYDRRMGAFCSLPAEWGPSPALLPLEWPDRQGAEVWLYLCRVAWGADLVPVPDGWNGR